LPKEPVPPVISKISPPWNIQILLAPGLRLSAHETPAPRRTCGDRG